MRYFRVASTLALAVLGWAMMAPMAAQGMTDPFSGTVVLPFPRLSVLYQSKLFEVVMNWRDSKSATDIGDGNQNRSDDDEYNGEDAHSDTPTAIQEEKQDATDADKSSTVGQSSMSEQSSADTEEDELAGETGSPDDGYAGKNADDGQSDVTTIASAAEEDQTAGETDSSDDGYMEKNAEDSQSDVTTTATAAEEHQSADESDSSDDGYMQKNAAAGQSDEMSGETPAVKDQPAEDEPASAEESADNSPVDHAQPSSLESADHGWWTETQAVAERWIEASLWGWAKWPVDDFRTAFCDISHRIARIDWVALLAGPAQDREVRQATPGVEPVQR